LSPAEVDISSPTEIELTDEDEETESGEKLVEFTNSQDITKSSAEAHEMELASSAEGMFLEDYSSAQHIYVLYYYYII